MRTPRVGEKVRVMGIPELANKELKISRVNGFFVYVRPAPRKPEIEVPIDDITYVSREILPKAEKDKLIEKWVKKESLEDVSNFLKEYGALSRLMIKYPDIDFWRQFNPSFQVRSLLWWLGGGKEGIKKYYGEFQYRVDSMPKVINLDLLKTGEDRIVENKVSVKDWLKD